MSAEKGRSRSSILLVMVVGLLLSSVARGQEVVRIPSFNAPTGTAALGGAIRMEQSLYFENENDDLRTNDFIPLYMYEGKYLFIHGTEGGVHFFKNDAFQFNLYTKYRFQKLDPNRNEYYAGLGERDQTVDAGLQLNSKQNWGDVDVSWVTDVLDKHNGEEVQLTYRYNFENGPWTFSPYVSLSWQDANLSNYYFGVSESEATADRPAYLPGESQWISMGLNTSWRATGRLELVANFGVTGAGSNVAESPLVAESEAYALFVGGTYVFGNALEPDYIMDDERQGEWSWRVNYGYDAHGNVVGEIDQGNFRLSEIANTNIAGLTLGKLLTAGKRADYIGRLAVFRHIEDGEGNGSFNSYAAYVMARGRGYSPWSGEETFRFGFGFGMSYADRVPIVEQRKQEMRSDNTSRFLSYLEMSVDVPLRRLSKANWLQRCYAGMSIVHRSGMFGSSDLLGDVAGGSDWITLHLECTR
jgi:outer membrane protein